MRIFLNLLLLCGIGVLWVGTGIYISSFSLSKNPSFYPSELMPAVVSILEDTEVVWTGVIVDVHRWVVLTSSHLFAPSKNYFIATSVGVFPLQSFITRSDDIALIKIDIPVWFHDAIASVRIIQTQDDVFLWQDVWSFWAVPALKSITLTRGVIAHIGQKVSFFPYPNTSFLQTDIRLMDGFSGGPLVDERGRIIGIHAGRLSDENISWSTPITQGMIDTLLWSWEKR
jgi:hypothetical protein